MHHLKLEIIQNQSFQDTTSSQSTNYWKSVFRSTTASQSGNCLKSVLSRPAHPFKVQTVQNKVLTRPLNTQNDNCRKNAALSIPQHPFKVEIVENESFQDHHMLPKWKLLKMIPFRNSTPSQSVNYPKQVLTRPPNPPQKVNCRKNAVLSRPPHPLSGNCWKWVLSRWAHLPKVQIIQKIITRPPHPPKVETVKKKQFFQVHLIPL